MAELHTTIGKLRDAIKCIGAGDDDADTRVVLAEREAFTSTDGDDMPAGLYVWLEDYPEEGCIGPLEDTASIDAPLVLRTGEKVDLAAPWPMPDGSGL